MTEKKNGKKLYWFPNVILLTLLSHIQYLLNMVIMPNNDSKNSLVFGPVVKSDNNPAMVLNIFCPSLPTNTSNTIRMSPADSGNWSSRHDVDGLDSNMVIPKRTMASHTSGLLNNLSITVDIAMMIFSSLAMNVEIVPMSSMNWTTLPLVRIPILDPYTYIKIKYLKFMDLGIHNIIFHIIIRNIIQVRE